MYLYTEKGACKMSIDQQCTAVQSLFTVYRKVVQTIWNAFISAHREKINWDDSDDLEQLSCAIFKLLVLDSLGFGMRDKSPAYDHFQVALDFLEVIPNQDAVVYVAMDSRSWTVAFRKELYSCTSFAFVDLFDFDVCIKREFEFFRIRITDCVDQNYVGKDALVKFVDATIRVRKVDSGGIGVSP